MKTFNFQFSIFNFKKGFTIVELLVFMGIFSVLIVVLTEILTSALEQQLRTESVANVEQDGRYILQRMIFDINRAKSITTPLPTPGISATSLQLTIEGATYLYAINSNNLTLSIDGGAAELLNGYNTTVSSPNFLRIGKGQYFKDSVQLSFTVTSKTIAKSGPQVKTYSTTAALRCETQSDATVKCN